MMRVGRHAPRGGSTAAHPVDTDPCGDHRRHLRLLVLLTLLFLRSCILLCSYRGAAGGCFVP
jgi:hypothetical protein